MALPLSPPQTVPPFIKYYPFSFISLINTGPALLQYFLLHSQHFPMELNFGHPTPSLDILFDRQSCDFAQEIDLLLDESPTEGIPTTKTFNFQMEQIISKFITQYPLIIQPQPPFQPQPLENQNHEKFQKTPSHPDSIRKQKKIKKAENSPFHNYQKHLNNALKKLIIVPQFQPHSEDFKLAAREIWDIYCRCDIKTKRILHFIFNERNEHSINQPELKTYRLWNVYQIYTPEVIAKAKNFLSKLAIDQLDDQNVEGYLKTRKLKSKVGFKEYILGFKTELQNGYLKRRVNGEKQQPDQ